MTEGSLGTADGTSVGRGTNLDGQCVIEITAPKKDVGDAAADATRGTHSIKIAALSGVATDAVADYTANTKVDTVSVDIQVGVHRRASRATLLSTLTR